VPRTATPGDHAGGITATLRAVVKSKSGQRFHLLQTVGSRVFIRVSGPLHPALTLKEIGARYQGAITSVGTGTTLVTYTIRNSGNVALGGHELLSISGLLGLKTSSGSAPNLQLLLPGYSVTQSVEVPGVVPQVWMNAHVSVSPLILPGTVQKLPDAYTGSAHFWAIPWWVLAVLLIGFAAFGVWWRRRHRGPKGPPKDERPSDPAQTQGSDTELEPDVVTVPERTEPEPVTVPDRTKPEPAAVPRSEPIRIPTYDADFPSGAGIDR
ncbi:MAG TPA: hypothetical protein VK646_13910, partial [Actinomycetota bacterium]|nr:hypothetical protein [Actinomycetota bacterium]